MSVRPEGDGGTRRTLHTTGDRNNIESVDSYWSLGQDERVRSDTNFSQSLYNPTYIVFSVEKIVD